MCLLMSQVTFSNAGSKVLTNLVMSVSLIQTVNTEQHFEIKYNSTAFAQELAQRLLMKSPVFTSIEK